MLNSTNILLIGKTPPPIGVVTIHLSRLLEYFDHNQYHYGYYDLKQFNIFSFFKTIKIYKYAHLHATNAAFLLMFVLSSKLFKTISIITIHADLGSYGGISAYFARIAIYFCNIPIILNKKSMNDALLLNTCVQKISSFIPPSNTTKLNRSIVNEIATLRSNTQYIICSNAWRYAYDKNGVETYGIVPLIHYINQRPHLGLIISDPSNEYTTYIKNNSVRLKKNVIIINENHSFFEVLRLSDCFIRNTSTDGDSISIKEALFLGIKVIASNCVDRPDGVELIKVGDLTKVEGHVSMTSNIKQAQLPFQQNGGADILKLYKEITSNN